jgi:CRISPR-associated protein Cst2
MSIKNILVVTESVMDMHRANNGQNQLGNATSIKRRPDGRVYISGQMQRHAFFEALRELDESDETYVSPGTATTHKVEEDLRADLGGFMQTDFSGLGDAARRTAPLSASPAVAAEESETLRDLLLQIKSDSDSQNLATMEMSQEDVMHAAWSLDCTRLSSTTRYEIAPLTDSDNSRGVRIGEEQVMHASPEERQRRAELMLKATRFVNAHASQARNLSSQEPRRVLIVLDTVLSRKGARYFQMSEAEQEAFIEEVESRGAKVFFGDDSRDTTVENAYSSALQALRTDGVAGGDGPQKTYEETYEGLKEILG